MSKCVPDIDFPLLQLQKQHCPGGHCPGTSCLRQARRPDPSPRDQSLREQGSETIRVAWLEPFNVVFI
jgi:hypothetical protein